MYHKFYIVQVRPFVNCACVFGSRCDVIQAAWGKWKIVYAFMSPGVGNARHFIMYKKLSQPEKDYNYTQEQETKNEHDNQAEKTWTGN